MIEKREIDLASTLSSVVTNYRARNFHLNNYVPSTGSFNGRDAHKAHFNEFV